MPPGSSPGTATAPRTKSAPSNAALLNANWPSCPWPPEQRSQLSQHPALPQEAWLVLPRGTTAGCDAGGMAVLSGMTDLHLLPGCRVREVTRPDASNIQIAAEARRRDSRCPDC